MRRRLCELEEHQRWVHHAVDLERGEIVTTSRERPITPLLRAGRLSELAAGDRDDRAAEEGYFRRALGVA